MAAPSAVRFYGKHGVITAIRDGGRRMFDESASCRIKVAKLARRVGLTVREIADLFTGLSPSAGAEEWGRMCGVVDGLSQYSESRTSA